MAYPVKIQCRDQNHCPVAGIIIYLNTKNMGPTNASGERTGFAPARICDISAVDGSGNEWALPLNDADLSTVCNCIRATQGEQIGHTRSSCTTTFFECEHSVQQILSLRVQACAKRDEDAASVVVKFRDATGFVHEYLTDDNGLCYPTLPRGFYTVHSNTARGKTFAERSPLLSIMEDGLVIEISEKSKVSVTTDPEDPPKKKQTRKK